MFPALRRVMPRRFALLAALWGLAVAGSFLLFSSLIGGPNDGRAELACAKEKLEAMWDVRLPAGAEVVAAVPGSGVVSADFDLKQLGCAGAVYRAATLKLPE